MSANTSTAVMARRAEPADSLDFFPTPPWATRAFCRHVLPLFEDGEHFRSFSALDPACGEGHMARVLEEYFPQVGASDIFDYGFGAVADFLHPDYAPPGGAAREARKPDWIITNPPFNRAAEFAQKALALAVRGAAMLVRTQFLEGGERWERLFRDRPPRLVAQFCERVPMHRGRWVVDGTTATAYCWIAWSKNPAHQDFRAGTRFSWIPPGRRQALSRPDDWERFSGCMDLPKDHPALGEPRVETPPLPDISPSRGEIGQLEMLA